jgi:hypothetical protein
VPRKHCLTLGLTLAALAALVLQSACAHYYLPANSLETPEAVGGFDSGTRYGRLELIGIQSGTDLITPPTVQPTDPKTGQTPNPELQWAPVNYAFGVTLGITPELDVGIKIEPFAPTLARVKYQFYGEPETKAESGNLSVAGAGSGGIVFGNGATFYSAQAALIAGYRFAAHHLASLAPFFNFAGLSGEGTASGNGTRYGASLGYQYDIDALILRVDLTWASGTFTQQSGPASDGGLFPGLLVGLKL